MLYSFEIYDQANASISAFSASCKMKLITFFLLGTKEYLNGLGSTTKALVKSSGFGRIGSPTEFLAGTISNAQRILRIKMRVKS